MQIEFNAKKRDGQGTGASRRLRHAGRIPGIVYGESSAPQSVDMDHNELFQLMRKEAFYSSVLTIDVEGAKELCLLRDVQRHPYKQLIMHLDFQRVDANKKLHTKVPFHFINADINPGVKLQGGIVSHVMNEVDVKCLPANLPEYIVVDLKDLSAGHSLHISQLALPEGVEVVHHREGDPVVATIMIKGGGKEAEAAPAAAAAPAKAAPAKAAPAAAAAKAPAKAPAKK
ncbi:MAG: 50S ribosomal protein L25/general stress protein Ctc [Rhodocyclaceae bacterium]|jgi:large subunit ribosomal protein L25|nr:50S ribosomal protein L25/general stress protein Ctc [Rhodocyclaceae bacterium]